VPRVLACLAALALVCGGCGSSSSPPVDVAAGRQLFRSNGCGSCHTLADARTHGPIGPNFDTSERLDRRQILSGLLEGSNGMPSFAALSLRKRRLLADYLLAVAWHGVH
jgi:mono/diheme cytochrome c family protein